MNELCDEKEKLLSKRCQCNLPTDKYRKSCTCRSKCSRCKRNVSYEEFYDTNYRCETCNSDNDGCEIKSDEFVSSRVNSICSGAANILSENLKYAFCIGIFLILLLVIILMLALLVAYLKQRTHAYMFRRNISCKEVNIENSSAFILASVGVACHKVDKFADPKKNLFYVIDRPLSIEQACNVESVLRLMPDKLVHFIVMDNGKMRETSKDTDYILHLQKYYNNLNRINTNKKNFFEGSLFENYWDKTDETLSTFAAKVLAIWQFGGAAVSENILMNSRSIFDTSGNKCMADKDLVYCPHECSAYTYDLMREIMNKMKSNSTTTNRDFEKLIEDSISEICSEDAGKTGCSQVYRLQKSDVCDIKSGGVCHFIRMDKLQKLDRYRETMKQFCPHIFY